jgi:hypothetical protein
MATQEIVLAIDAYIAQLKEARDLIASLCLQSETSDRKPLKQKSRQQTQPVQVPAPPPDALEVAVQVIPARAPRQRRRLAAPASPGFSALGGAIPKGPVVIRSSDLARAGSVASRAHPTVQAQQPTTSHGALEELAREVSKRLASRGGFSR